MTVRSRRHNYLLPLVFVALFCVLGAIALNMRVLKVFAGYEKPVFDPQVNYGVQNVTESYSITYDESLFTLLGAENSPDNPHSYTSEDEKYLKPATRRGYDFVRWTCTNNSSILNGYIPKGTTGNLVFAASNWTRIEYTVTYILGEGGVNDSKNPTSYNITTATKILQIPTRAGYDFLRWEEDGATVTSIPNGSVGNKTLTAIWRISGNMVSFECNGGTKIDERYFKEGQAVIVSNAERTGFRFLGWYFDEILELKMPDDYLMPSIDIKLYASWEIIEYTIDYILNGGENDEDNPDKYTVMSAISLKPSEKTGYIFQRWEENEVQSNTILPGSTGNKIFTAIFIAIEYSLTYNLDGGENDGDNPVKYTIENTITLMPATKKGYNFLHWLENGNITIKIASGSMGEKTFTAVFEVIEYLINYVLDGGENDTDNPNKYTVENIVTLKPATKAGYGFLYWLESETESGGITKGSIGEKTFIAIFEVIEYSINYVLDGGENDTDNPNKYTVENAVALKPATKTGYDFLYWLESEAESGGITKGSIGEKTFIAIFEVIEYSINYVLDGGENDTDNPNKYTVENVVALKPATKTGYDFLYWLESEAESGGIIKGSIGEKAFTAVFEVIEYSINYVLDGGENDTDNPNKYTVENAVALKPATKTGYDFLYWLENEAESGGIIKGSIGEKTFTAIFEVIEYSINYVLDGGENDTDNPNKYTVENAVALKSATKTGYEFLYWLESETESGDITKGTIGEKAFTAVFEVIEYSINYVLDGGENDIDNPNKYTIENAVTLKSATKKGYSFLHWLESEAESGGITKGTVGEKTFTAVFIIIEYKINYNLSGGVNNINNPDKYTVESAVILKPPTKKGYSFIQWIEGVTVVTEINQGDIGIKTFTAVWDVIRYNITYNLDGGVNNSDNPQDYTVEDTFALFNPLKDGYLFKRWTEGGATICGIATGNTGDRFFTVIWELINYNIIYVLDGGINNPDNPDRYTIIDNITLSAPSKSGYIFIKWEEGGKILEGEIGDKTFTAVWEAKSNSFGTGSGGDGRNTLPVWALILIIFCSGGVIFLVVFLVFPKKVKSFFKFFVRNEKTCSANSVDAQINGNESEDKTKLENDN